MKEITLNNEIYVLKKDIEEIKEEEKLDVYYEHFNINIQKRADLILKKLRFTEQHLIHSDEVLMSKENVAVMDGANICMVVAKSEKAKMLLKKYINIDKDDVKVPELTFDTNCVSKYDAEEIKNITDFFYSLRETNNKSVEVSIEMNKDHPIKIFNDDFEFILAPRVDGD